MDPLEYQKIIKKRTKPRERDPNKKKSCNCGKNNNIHLPNPHL
jgi:hypothetical protein